MAVLFLFQRIFKHLPLTDFYGQVAGAFSMLSKNPLGI